MFTDNCYLFFFFLVNGLAFLTLTDEIRGGDSNMVGIEYFIVYGIPYTSLNDVYGIPYTEFHICIIFARGKI